VVALGGLVACGCSRWLVVALGGLVVVLGGLVACGCSRWLVVALGGLVVARWLGG
jgi:hypothetical protein